MRIVLTPRFGHPGLSAIARLSIRDGTKDDAAIARKRRRDSTVCAAMRFARRPDSTM